jgi:3',5'-cyclic AMP phosphodiesterase CpdA
VTPQTSRRGPEAGPRGVSTLAFIADPHFGRHEPAAIEALGAAIEAIDPDLVIAGGDLTHRARARQFREVRAFLDGLPAPWLAIPGNHDVPLYDLFRRVFLRLGRYHHFITEDRAPRRHVGDLRIVGLDSTRRKVTGRLRADRIYEIHDAEILVTHHPLVRRPLDGAEAALAAARAAGVELVLAGHHHRFHVTPGEPIAVEAPSVSHLLEPKKGFVVLRISPEEIAVEPWWLHGIAFAADPPTSFMRRPA